MFCTELIQSISYIFIRNLTIEYSLLRSAHKCQISGEDATIADPAPEAS